MTNSSSDFVRYRPIIILGAPRSGTTLLGQTLARHPALTYLEEPRLTWRYGNDNKSDMLRPSDARPAVCEHIRKSFAEQVSAQNGARLLEKTPSNALRPGFVDAVFPEAVYIHIIRSGLDSVPSIESFWHGHSGGVPVARLRERLKEIRLSQAPRYARELLRRMLPDHMSRMLGHRVWGPRLPGMNALLSELDTLEIACLQWRACVETTTQFLRTLPPERYFECRLEDLSWETVQQIMTFCDLPASEEVEQYFHGRFQPGQTSQRASALDPAKRHRILQWIEPTMTWLGYGASATAAAGNDSPHATA